MKHHRITRSVLSAALLAAVALPASAARVDYVIDAGVERSDNLLVTADDEIQSTVLRAGVGFVVTEDTSRLQASIEGRMDYWNYDEGGLSDTVEGRLAGRLNWFLVPDSFSFTIEDSLEVEAIDRFAPDSPDNRQRVNVLSLGPNFHFNWNPTLRGQAEFRWIRSDAEVSEEFDSDRIAGVVRVIKALDSGNSLTGSVHAQDVDFDHDLSGNDFRRYDAYLSYGHAGPRIEYGIDAGYSRVEYDTGGGASHPLARGHLRWAASARSSLTLDVSHQLSDAASAAISALGGEVGVPPGQLVTGNSVVDASVYEEDHIGLTYMYEGELHSLSISSVIDRIDYLDATSPDEDRRGIGAAWSYRLSPGWTVGAYADRYDTEYRNVGQSEEELRAGLFATRTWSRHWATSLRYTHYHRDPDWIPGDVRQNVWYLTVSYRNR